MEGWRDTLSWVHRKLLQDARVLCRRPEADTLHADAIRAGLRSRRRPLLNAAAAVVIATGGALFGTVADANARFQIDPSKLPEPWSKSNCRSSTAVGGPAAFAVFGRPIAPLRWNRIVFVFAETAPADREVSESEAKNSTAIQVGLDRTRARLQVFAGRASVDWWKDGVKVGITAAGNDRKAVVTAAQTVTATSNGSTMNLRVSPVRPRVLIAQASHPKSSIRRLTCITGPGGRQLDIEFGDGIDPASPPDTAGDELVKFTVGSNLAWRTSSTLKLGESVVTRCLLTMKLSANTRATLSGPAPCDVLQADAATLATALR